MENCTLCENELIVPIQGGGGIHYNCPQCGEFFVPYSTTSDISSRELFEANKHLIAGFFFETRNRDTEGFVSLDRWKITEILQSSFIPISTQSKKVKILQYINTYSDSIGNYIEIPSTAIYLKNTNDELYEFLVNLDSHGLVRNASTDGVNSAAITVRGVEFLETL